jgi:hypothetical protein
LLWFLNITGHYLLFSPILSLLNWIPLVGKLISAIVGFAAFIFSLIWGSMLHLMVMTFAWIFYRPLFGMLLLCLSAALFFLTFSDDII